MSPFSLLLQRDKFPDEPGLVELPCEMEDLMVVFKKIVICLLLFFVFQLGCIDGPVVTETHLPAKAIKLNSSNFDSIVNNEQELAFVEIYSSLCMTCSSVAWVIDSIAEQMENSMVVGAIDMESDSLWKRFTFKSVPTYFLFRNGKIIKSISYDQIQSSPYSSLTNLLTYVLKGVQDSLPLELITLDSLTFDSFTEVDGRLSFVEFFSPYCHYCMDMESTVTQLSGEYAGLALMSRVNMVTDNVLKYEFGVQGIPSFHFLKSGKEVRRIVGAVPKDSLSRVLDSLLFTN